MPVVMNMRWSGVTPEQYDAARQTVNSGVQAVGIQSTADAPSAVT